MINLFKDKVDSITFTIVDDKISFNINLEKEDVIRINWDECKYQDVTINIFGSFETTLLEIGEPYNKKVTINLDDNTNVKQSIASFIPAGSTNYEVNLNENASYVGAFADFSYGNKNFNYICNLRKPYAHATWNLATLSSKEDKKNFTISFFHYAPHTYAKMENYGVCENEAVLNFFGTSSIEKGAKTSATHQSAKIMVFDKNCKAKASPKLCIDENDVEASHAAVVGQINEEHIFYLTSRGIQEDVAKKLITLGYLNPILGFFVDKDVNAEIKKNIEGRF